MARQNTEDCCNGRPGNGRDPGNGLDKDKCREFVQTLNYLKLMLRKIN